MIECRSITTSDIALSFFGRAYSRFSVSCDIWVPLNGLHLLLGFLSVMYSNGFGHFVGQTVGQCCGLFLTSASEFLLHDGIMRHV